MNTSNYKSGIYRITTPSGEYYIGSSKNIEFRWKNHQLQLKNGTHKNRWMQRKFKVSPDNWTCEVVEEVSVDQLLIAEQKYLDEHHGLPGCMNVNPQASKGPAFTKENAQNPEWRRKQKAAAQLKYKDPLYLRKLSESRKELLADPVRREKFIAAMNTPARAAKISQTLKGRPKPFLKGKPNPKLSAVKLGVPWSTARRLAYEKKYSKDCTSLKQGP